MSESGSTVGDHRGYDSGYDSEYDSGSDSEPGPHVRKEVTFAPDINRIRTYQGTDLPLMAWRDASKVPLTDGQLQWLEQTDFV